MSNNCHCFRYVLGGCKPYGYFRPAFGAALPGYHYFVSQPEPCNFCISDWCIHRSIGALNKLANCKVWDDDIRFGLDYLVLHTVPDCLSAQVGDTGKSGYCPIVLLSVLIYGSCYFDCLPESFHFSDYSVG